MLPPLSLGSAQAPLAERLLRRGQRRRYRRPLKRAPTRAAVSRAGRPRTTRCDGWPGRGLYHPHLHGVVSGGGLLADGTQWIGCRAGFFLPVRVPSRRFRRLFLDQLVEASEAPSRSRDYVGRYTHRVALSNNRLLDLADGEVSFRYKDYRHGAQPKTMTLAAEKFIRRFLLHVLPAGFQRIRYYGFLGNRYRKEKLARCRQLLGMLPCPAPVEATSPPYPERYEALTGVSLRQCPVCHQGWMRVIEILPRSCAPAVAIIDSS